MKTYAVVFDPQAEAEALEAADYIARTAPDAAARWYMGLQRAIESLATVPDRCGRARESETIGKDLRQLVHGTYRIIFRIEEDAATVRVLHVRHAARRTLGEPARNDDESDDR